MGSRHQLPWGSPEPCRDIKSVSRHHSLPNPGSRPSKRGSDTVRQPSPKPGRNTKTRSRPSWRLPYVATSISCRDLISAESGISRSRHQNFRSRPPTLPPMSRPQMMSRPQIQLAKSQPQILRSQLQKAIPRRDPQIHATSFLPNQNKRGRDLQDEVARSATPKFTVSSCDAKIPSRLA